MGPAISSSAFWVSKGLKALKILSAVSALYNQKYCYETSGIYDNVIYPPSHAGVFSGADGHKVAIVYGTPSRTVSHRRGKGRKYTYTF
jgi:hypothetical protein